MLSVPSERAIPTFLASKYVKRYNFRIVNVGNGYKHPIPTVLPVSTTWLG
jgi:hypothetical protein